MSESQKSQVAGLTGDALEEALTHAYNEQDDWTGAEDERPETAPMSPMTTTTHTPGPWEAVHYSGTDAYSDVCAQGNCLISGDIDLLSFDDACLIAAAPDLLEACRKALTCASIPDYVADVIRAAIAKAEGRG